MKIVIDEAKAIEVTKNKLRAWREAEFKKNDIAIQNAIVDGDDVAKAEAIAHRDYLRNLPNECDGKTLDELKSLLVEKGI
jgi:hypothetical protein